ncbi:MAG TPA: phosphotransferase [Candidatus Saccharimonadales bacterium]|nr:phosphotransferase [Candidatus Saccharimonadales bacterium]
MASPELIARILQQYGVQALVVETMQTGYRNEIYPLELAAGITANLILYKREPGIAKRIQNANRVGNYLASRGLPARQTLDERIIQLHGDRSTTYGALYTRLPGHTIPWEAYTMEHIKNLGGMMSTIHAKLDPLARGGLPDIAAEYHDITNRMQQYFEASGVQNALRVKLHLTAPNDWHHIHNLLDKLAKLPHQQALHMDFVRGNILFDDARHITGILDFEKAAWGNSIFDIARTLAFLLVDCKHKTEQQVRKYFLHSGYHKRGPTRLTDVTYLEALINLFLLYDFYKFLLHNPYESLSQNEHFVRTSAFLLQRKILAKV